MCYSAPRNWRPRPARRPGIHLLNASRHPDAGDESPVLDQHRANVCGEFLADKDRKFSVNYFFISGRSIKLTETRGRSQVIPRGAARTLQRRALLIYLDPGRSPMKGSVGGGG